MPTCLYCGKPVETGPGEYYVNQEGQFLHGECFEAFQQEQGPGSPPAPPGSRCIHCDREIGHDDYAVSGEQQYLHLKCFDAWVAANDGIVHRPGGDGSDPPPADARCLHCGRAIGDSDYGVTPDRQYLHLDCMDAWAEANDVIVRTAGDKDSGRPD